MTGDAPEDLPDPDSEAVLDLFVRVTGEALAGGDGSDARTPDLVDLAAAVAEWHRAELAEHVVRTEAHSRAVLDGRVREAQDAARLDLLRAVTALGDVLDTARAVTADDGRAPWIRTLDNRIDRILAEQGYERIACVGAQFDPAVHEAAEHRAAVEVPAGTVVAELGRGYRRGDFVLRPARVVVSSGDP